jgi:dihydropteroate synthase
MSESNAMSVAPHVLLPQGAGSGVPPADPGETPIGPISFRWGARTYLMGIVNVTPDSFSGDGLLAAAAGPGRAMGTGPQRRGSGGERGSDSRPVGSAVQAAVDQARRMVAAGADILDVGGESTRPGAPSVPEPEERQRVVPVIRAIRDALPAIPVSVDTTKPTVAEAALDAGAHLLNHVWGTGESDALARIAAERGVPLVVMHNRAEARYVNVVAEVLADLQRAVERALAAGVPWEHLIVDPGMGFGKTPEQNLALLHDLAALRLLRRPILLGMSRKSTIGVVLGLPVTERLEGTLATTALAVAAGVDIVRVHDVEPNRRVARMADAVVRG